MPCFGLRFQSKRSFLPDTLSLCAPVSITPTLSRSQQIYIYIYICVCVCVCCVCVGDCSEGWPKEEKTTLFPGFLHFTLDPYLIMQSVKQGGIKYHFLSLWYDSIWEPRSPGPLVNTLSIMPMSGSVSSTEKDIDTRLTKAWTAIDKLSVILKSDLTDKMKRNFFQAAAVSILLYGCTTWTLT